MPVCNSNGKLPSVKNQDLRLGLIKGCEEIRQDLSQREPEPPNEAAKVVTDSRENGIGGIAHAVPEVTAAHSMPGLEVVDDRLGSGAPSQLTLDLRRQPPLRFTGTFLFGNRPQFELMRHLSARKPDRSVRDHPCLWGIGVANKTRPGWKVRIRLPAGRG
jgi:hypothetical protein